MKQKIYIAALLAGMLALAGCGGGSSSSGQSNGNEPQTFTTDEINDLEVAARKDACDVAGLSYNAATEKCGVDTSAAKDAAAETMAKNLHAALVGTGATNNEAAAQTYTFDGTKVTVNPTGDTTTTDDINLTKTTDSVSPNNGWDGGHFKGTGTGKNHEARVYWNTRDGKEANFTAPTLSAGVDESIAIDSAVGRTGGKITLTDAKQSDAHNFEAKGSYNGVAGTYKCTGVGTCEATITGTGIRLSAGWVFAPTNPNSKTTPKHRFYFGWWLNKDADGTGTDNPHQVDVFSGVSQNVGNPITTSALGGTATYNGGAAGKYANYNATPGVASEAGHFTADATLKIGFDAAPTLMEGTIDEFMVDGQKQPWSVALKKPATPVLSGTAVLTVGESESKDTASPTAQRWTAQLYDAGTDGLPNTVLGTFDVSHGDIEMEGAFGANKQ